MDAVRLFDRKNGNDVGMFELGDGPRFALEALAAVLVARHVIPNLVSRAR
jgi:hypothetical protein